MPVQRSIPIPHEISAFISGLPPLQKKGLRAALRYIEENPGVGKILRDELAGYRSYPVGPLRIIYEEKGRELVIAAVDYRVTIYELLTRELQKKIPLIKQKRSGYKGRGNLRKKGG